MAGIFRVPQVAAGVVEISGHLRIAGRGDSGGCAGRHGGAARRRYRAAWSDHRGGGPAHHRTHGGHIAWGKVGRERCPGVQGIGAGGAEAGRDEGGVFTDVLILSCPAVRCGHRLDGGGDAVVRVTRGVDGILQRSSGAGRDCQGGGHAQQAEKYAQFLHSASSSFSWRRL